MTHHTGLFTIGGQTLTRHDLLALADDFAARVAGARALAVVAEPTMEAVTAVLGGIAAGVPVVPMNPTSGPRERNNLLDDSGADLLFEGGALTSHERPGSLADIPDDTVLVLYTSGTTGLPKGVPITSAAIAACIESLAAAWDWTPDDLLVHGLPLYHAHGLVLGVLGPLQLGSGLHHTGRPTPEAYAGTAGTLFFGVPTIWARIAKDPSAARALAPARALVSGSAGLPPIVFDEIRALTGHAPIERYGMTETLITISTRIDGARRAGVVGTPLEGVRTRIMNEKGHRARHDGVTIGELQVQGPTVFSGYLNRPDATAGTFTRGGWMRSGDIASIAPDGTHRILGRATTDLITSGGYRIGSGEIEDTLLAHPGVHEAAVVGVPDDELGQRIVAYVVATGCTEQGLIAHVAQQLSWAKRPRQVRFVEELPRNAMGKVEKARLVSD